MKRHVLVFGLPGATKVYDPVSNAFTSFATVSDAPTIFIGAVKPDADPGSQNTGANAANALGDDTNKTDDEDGVASFPPLTIVTGSYSIQVAATNTSGSDKALYGWIDFNGDGRFEPTELQMAPVLSSGGVASVTLTWPNPPVASGATFHARLRFTSSLPNDNPGTPADERAQGTASDGEVEDYLIPVTPLGSLTVIKNAVGGDGSFSFNTTGLSPVSFTLTTAGGTAQRTFPDLLPGNYSVTELLSPAWDLTSATCSDGSNPASIDLALSENVTCTFTNQAASYSVSATVSGGYGGTVSCTPASTTAGGSSACTAIPDAGFLVLGWGGDCAAAGSNIQCTLKNIFADKFSTVRFVLIPPATYSVSATVIGGSYGSVGCYPSNVKAGDSSTCIATPEAGYQVAHWDGACLLSGQNAQCTLSNLQTDLTSTVTFESTRQDTLTVVKRTVGGDGPFLFVSRSLGDFSLTTVNGEAQRSFGNLAPGLYDLSETVPAGWIQISAVCDNGDAPDNIRLAPGQTVKCTFVNRHIDMIADIPTLSEWGLLILGVLLLTLGARWYGPMRLARQR